jgi:hypothetical protein
VTAIIVFLLIFVYFRRRQRLRRPTMHPRIESDPSGSLFKARGVSHAQAQGTVTPFTLPLPIDVLSELHTPFSESSSMTFPPMQPHCRQQKHSSQPVSGVSLEAGSEGRREDSLITIMQNIHIMQRRLILLEQHSSRERVRDWARDRRGLRKTAITRTGVDPRETRSAAISDAPPTYISTV